MRNNRRLARLARHVALAATSGAVLFQTSSCAIQAPDYTSYQLLNLIRSVLVNGLTYLIPQLLA